MQKAANFKGFMHKRRAKTKKWRKTGVFNSAKYLFCRTRLFLLRLQSRQGTGRIYKNIFSLSADNENIFVNLHPRQAALDCPVFSPCHCAAANGEADEQDKSSSRWRYSIIRQKPLHFPPFAMPCAGFPPASSKTSRVSLARTAKPLWLRYEIWMGSGMYIPPREIGCILFLPIRKVYHSLYHLSRKKRILLLKYLPMYRIFDKKIDISHHIFIFRQNFRKF